MRRLLAAAMMAFSLVATGWAQTEGFKTYKSADGRFEVSGPGDPMKSTRTLPSEAGPIQLENYEFFQNSDKYLITVSPLSRDVAEGYQNGSAETRKQIAGGFFAGVSRGVLKSVEKAGNCKVTKSETEFAASPPFSVLEIEISGRDGGTTYIFGKFLFTGDRVYSLVTFSKAPREEGTRKSAMFFNSFRIFQSPPAKTTKDSVQEKTGLPRT